ncbi:MBL fold metallo-hydrolase [Dactylosporangium sp. NPDC051541]|uniref:MBL fold metallo-hydrolase n=1 Tax=Dactylosporangium sp. NPDC051541 TaxID=3363977 RepID=UPI0037AA6CBC
MRVGADGKQGAGPWSRRHAHERIPALASAYLCTRRRPADATIMEIGDVNVEFVPDGEVRGRPEALFPGSDWSAHTHLLDGDGNVIANVGSFLVRTPTEVVLVDVGLGGELLTNLGALGVAPDDVDLVVLTHLHRDHVGWVGAFPRARYAVDRREWEYWCEHPGGVGPDPDRVLAHIEGRRETLDHRRLTAISTPGHTPGHTSVLVTGAETDQRLLILGDLLHTRAQYDNPDWAFRSDVDAERARASRLEVFARFRDARTVFADGHFHGVALG